MLAALRPKLTYANVVATLALIIAIGGATAFAATQLPKNSVGSKQLKKDSVTGEKVKGGAIAGGELAPGAVSADKVAPGAVTTDKLGNDSVTGEKVAEGTLGRVPDAASLEGIPASSFARKGLAEFHLVTTLNGWSASKVDTPAGYWVDQEGVVHLQGVLYNGTANLAFVLPPAVWPTHNVIYTIFCPSGGGVGILNIFQLSGEVHIANAGGSTCNTGAHLEGVTYRPDL